MCAARMSQSMGRQRRRTRGFRWGFASWLTLQTDSSRCCQHLRNTSEVVGCGGEHEEPLDQAAATMPGLAQTADRLDPPEWFFDPLALDRADAIAGMPGRARVDRRATVGVVLRDMRRAAALAATGDKVGGVIVLVGAHGAARLGIVLDYVEGGRSLRRTVGLGEARIDNQPVAVLHHQMPHVAELGLLASALAEQAGVGVGSRGMRVVLALLAMEVALGIAPLTAARLLTRWWIIAILRHEALHAGPCLDQRAIDREVLTGQEPTHLRQVQHGDKELGRDVAVEQTIPVLAEHGRIPHWIVPRQNHKPAGK